MTYRSHLYVWIYNCTHQYLSINFGIKRIKNPFKFDFRLNTSDLYLDFFARNLKYKNLFTMFFRDICISYFF
jgi:hypothetical protein